MFSIKGQINLCTTSQGFANLALCFFLAKQTYD